MKYEVIILEGVIKYDCFTDEDFLDYEILFKTYVGTIEEAVAIAHEYDCFVETDYSEDEGIYKRFVYDPEFGHQYRIVVMIP